MTDQQFSPTAYPSAQPTTPSDPTAVMGRRFAAWIIDLVLYLLVVVSVFGLTAEYFEIDDEARADLAALVAAGDVEPGATVCDVLLRNSEVSGCAEINDRAYLSSGSDQAIQVVVAVAYFVVFHILLVGILGASPGKALVGLRVVDEAGRIAGIGKATIRNLLWAIDGVPFVVGPVVGLITAVTSTGHRRVGDLAAKTYVVGRSSVGRPPFGAAEVVWSGPVGAPETWSPPDTAEDAPATWAPPSAPSTPTGWDPTAAPAPSAEWNPPTPDPSTTPTPSWGAPPETPTPAGDIGSRAEAGDTEAETTVASPAWTPVGDDAPTAEPDLPSDTTPPVPSASPETPAETEADAAADAQPEPEPEADADAETAARPEPEAQPALGAEPLENPPPQWDQARNTYIQWDANAQRWLQWDTAGERWKPIDT